MKSFKSFLTENTTNIINTLDDFWYHGSVERKVDAILETGKIKPRLDGEQMSGGLISERPFVYFTNDQNIAKQYAFGLEANMVRNKDKEKPGAIFYTNISKLNLKTIDLKGELTTDQLEVVNRYLPDYKPLHEGASLQNFMFRTNAPEEFHEVITALGCDSYLQEKNQLAILGEVPVSLYKDYRGQTW